MGLDDLYLILSAVYPTAYWSFPEGEAPPMPFICYFEESSDNFAADNIVYHHTKTINIELLTRAKDPEAEQAVETALTNAGIYWEKASTHLDDEDAYECIYTLEV